MGKLVIDGNSVYEIDEDCVRRKEKEERLQTGRETAEGRLWHDGKAADKKPQNLY